MSRSYRNTHAQLEFYEGEVSNPVFFLKKAYDTRCNDTHRSAQNWVHEDSTGQMLFGRLVFRSPATSPIWIAGPKASTQLDNAARN